MTATSNKPEIIMYQSKDGQAAIDVRMEGDTLWLSQKQMSALFNTSTDNVGLHLKNIFDEQELDFLATTEDYSVVQIEGSREVTRSVKHYNLDAIIAVGYRVRSTRGTQFRQWATPVLHEYLQKGFTMNDDLLKNNGGGLYFKELLDRIRDIRASEKVLYRQVLELYATSLDYDASKPETVKFFKIVQNKLHYAVSGSTASELIFERANAELPFMGLTAFKGSRPVKSEVSIAKNYMTEDELFGLRRMVNAFFDIAEYKAENEEPVYMKDWLEELDDFTKRYTKRVLKGAGEITSAEAAAKAVSEYGKYQSALHDELSDVEVAYLNTLRDMQKRLEDKR